MHSERHVSTARTALLAALALPAILSGCDAKKPPPGPAPTYTLGGTVNGLSGSVALTNNGGDTRSVAMSGAFTFATSLASGATYNVAISSQPATQTCSVTGGTGAFASSNVINVTISCVTNTFTVGGTVTGLVGAGLVLQNNGADNLARNADGAFTFATQIAQGGAYNVSVVTQPSAPVQTCTPSSNTGTIAANVTNITVVCLPNSTVGSALIGPAGGTVTGFYGATITVPAGALANTVTIGLSRDSSNSPAFAVTDVDAIGATHELTPHGQSFSLPVTLHIPFDPTQLPNDETPVLYKAEVGGAFTALPTTVNGNFLEATVTGFSWVIPASQSTKPRMVYAIQAAGTFSAGALASLKIDRTTGALSAATSTAAIGESPVSVVAHPSRRFVYVTNGGSSTVNSIAPNSISTYQLNTVNGKITGPASSTTTTSAALGYQPTMPAIHPSGKFLYVMNFGSVSSNNGGDIDLFTINGATGALTRSVGTISGGGAQPMAVAFNRLGTIAYVLYAGSSSANSFSSQIKTYTVDLTTGAFTGPTSGIAACVLGGNPWSLRVDPNDKFAYAACLSTDVLIVYSINNGTGALTNIGSTTVTAGSKLASLAIDSFGRFLFVGRQQPWLSKNVLSYQYNATSGALTFANDLLTACPGGGCVGPISMATDPQGQFVYALDSQQGLSGFAVNQTSGAITAVNSLTGIYRPVTAGIGVPFIFAVTGTSPVWQNNCTHNCALTGVVMSGGGGGSGGGMTNPTPPTSHHLTVTQGAYYGYVTSSPAGIDIAPATASNPLPPNSFSASFPANTNVQLCTSPPPQPSQAYDVTWTGSCSGTGICANVSMTRDKQCHVEFVPIIGR